MPGALSTSVGYTGGSSSNPTYNSVCRGDGHTEALKISFDPDVISYEDVMQKVLANASSFKAKKQYMEAVWTLNPEQEKAAKTVAKKLAKSKPTSSPRHGTTPKSIIVRTAYNRIMSRLGKPAFPRLTSRVSPALWLSQSTTSTSRGVAASQAVAN